MEIVYYEDIELHQKLIAGEHYVDKEEMIEFAKKWDALPFHIDEELAKSYPAGGLIAPVAYVISVITRVGSISEQPRIAVLAGLEFERIQMTNPVRPGDQLVITSEHIDKRESRTRPDRGIVRTSIEVRNQNDELCLSTISTILALKRPT